MALRPGYAQAAPSFLTKPQVHSLGESIASQLGYEPGCELRDIVQKIGGRVTVQATLLDDPEQSGSLYVNKPNDFEIIVPAHTSLLRDQFTIAHELGHYVLHYAYPKHQGKNIPDRVVALRKGSNRIEWEANWFAAAFLMPSKKFRAAHKNTQGNVEQIAAMFRVSQRAVEIRIQDLNLS